MKKELRITFVGWHGVRGSSFAVGGILAKVVIGQTTLTIIDHSEAFKYHPHLFSTFDLYFHTCFKMWT